MQSYPQSLKGTSMDLASTATSDGKEFTLASSVPVPLPRSDSLGRSARRSSGPKLASSPPPIPPRSITAVVSSDDGSPSVSPPPVINSISDSNRKTTKTKKTKTFNFFGNNIRYSRSLHSQQKPRRESDKKQYNNEPFSVGSPVVPPKSPVVRSSSTKTTPTSVAADAVPNPDLGTLDYEHSLRTFEHRSSIPQELISKQNLGSSQQELAEDPIVRTVERSESQTTDSIRKERNQITGKRFTVPANYSMKGIRGPFGEKLESQKRRSGSDFDYEDYGTIMAHPTQSQQSLDNELLESQKIIGKTKTNDSEKKPPSFLISKHVSKTLKQQASEESMISEELTTTDDERCEHHFEPETHLASLPDIKTANSPRNVGQKNDGGDGVDLKSITATIGRHLDMREHIVGELYDTEKTYCETLKTLYQTFILYKCSSATPAHLPVPLSSSGGCLESFTQLLPDGMNLHGKLLEQLRHKIANWSPDETDIGNIFEILNDDNLVQFYEYVIRHFNEIMAILKTNQQCIEQKTASSERPKSGSKLMLHDLLISIVQRMFQYKALLERLIKNTKSHHCDYIPLQIAEKNVHDFLNKINTVPGQGIGFGGGGGGGNGAPNENHSTSSSSSASAVSNNVRHLFLKELETLIECDQTILEQYGPNPNVHFYDNVMIKKREQTIFVLDSCILLGQRKNKKKSQFELSRYKLQKVFQIENVNLRCQCQRGSYHQSGSIVGSYPLQNMPNQSTSGGGNSGLANGNSGNNVGTFGTNATIGDQFDSITACQICIEHLESDICNLSKMQKRACRLNNETTRRIIESMLYEQLQLVVKQLAEKNERMSRCFIDCSVDIFVSPDLEDPNMGRNDSPQQSSPLLADNKIRITHNKCIRHRKTCGFQPESVNTSIRTNSGRQTTNQNGGSSDLLTIIFSNFKKREEFESTVNGLKVQIVKSRFRMEFLSQIPYQRARARIQLTCALPAMGTNNIWICQSDGFVGQIGVLSLENINVPMIISCNGVCNARILFLKSVPPCQFSPAFDDNRNAVNVEGPKRPQSLMIKNQDRDQFIKVNEDENLDKTLARPRSMSRMKSERRRLSTNCNSNDGDSSNDEENNQTVQQQKVAKKPIKRRSKKLEKHQLKPNETPVATDLYPMQKSSTALGLFPADITSPDCQIIDTDSSFDVLPSKKCNESKDRIAAITPDCPTMWFGTDDSTIHIYSCLNAVRTGKNKAKVTLKAKIESIEYFKGKVFVGLANHTVAIFIRDANGYWQTTPKIISDIHCFRFCVVQQNQLWTTSGNLIQIRDEQLKCIEEPIIIQEVEKICFIIENQSIFIASEQSSYVYRYSTEKPYQLLASISIGQSVDRALKSFEEILRYHKNQCLKICSMHLVRDRILVGTSAGVIVTLDQNNTVEIVPNGHTGNVRFITSTSTSDGRLWVVSGGDGVEKYAPGTSTSTNSPGEFSNFMAYCSHLAQNLLGRTSSNASSLTPAQSQMNILSASTISGCGGSGSIVTTPIMAPEDTEIISSPSIEQKYSVVNPIQSPQTPAHSLQHQPRKDEKDSVACGESDSQSYLLVWKII